MAFGLDYVSAPPIADLKSAGVTFVCRYLSEVNNLTQIKLLTPAEAKTLGENGISIVSNYEWYGNRAAEGFASGVYDAKIAEAQHAACGGPANRPIYFSVDFNTGATTAIIDYFRGVASVIGLARTGAYGGYACIKGLLDAGAIRWAWQTYAWSNGQWDSRAHIQQYQNGVMIANHSVDYDRSMQADFGQWVPQGGFMIPTGWHDDGSTLTAPNGHKVVFGFRSHVLNNAWDPNNQPLEEEWHADPLELSNLSLGAGQKQSFNQTTLEYTVARGVFEAWQGQELVALRAEIAKLQSTPPVPAPVDTSTVESDINAIADAMVAPMAKALADLKKL
jgi:hypothetical protein